MVTPLLALVAVSLAAGPLVPPPDSPPGVPGGWAVAAASSRVAPADTVVPLRPGDRLVVQNFSGRIVVRTWSEGALRIGEAGGGHVEVEVRRSGEVVRLRAGDSKGRGSMRPLTLQVPAWVAVDLDGPGLHASVDGVLGGVRVRTVEGEIFVRGAEGDVDVRSVEGPVVVEDSRGRVRAHSVDGNVRLLRVSGEVAVQSVDGDVLLDDVTATRVTASTVDGDVRFTGPLEPGGEYRLSTHDGDVVAELAEPVDALVLASTFDGEFFSDLAVTVDRFEGGKVLRFTLGDGSARLVLEAFDGSVRLLRRGR